MKEDKKNQVINLLSKNQFSRAVGQINSYRVAPLDTDTDKYGVRIKYPNRKIDISTDITKKAPVDNMRGLRENLTKLRKGASPGTGCLRPEYLVAMGKEFNGTQMANFEELTLSHVK